MFDKLPGKKTYLIIAGLIAWKATEVIAGDYQVSFLTG